MNTLTIRELPPLADYSNTSDGISIYLTQLLHSQESEYIFLPSPKELSLFFNRAIVDVHEALHALCRQGYGFLLQEIDAPITFWCFHTPQKQPSIP